MNINFKDYLSEEEIKEIIIDELRKEARNHFCNEKEFTRILTNISYYELWKKIEEEVPNSQYIIKEKVKEKLNEISSYDILRKKGEFNDSNSLAYDILEKYVDENKNIIEDKVKDIFSELSKTDLKYEIQGILENYIEKLFLKESGE